MIEVGSFIGLAANDRLGHNVRRRPLIWGQAHLSAVAQHVDGKYQNGQSETRE